MVSPSDFQLTRAARDIELGLVEVHLRAGGQRLRRRFHFPAVDNPATGIAQDHQHRRDRLVDGRGIDDRPAGGKIFGAVGQRSAVLFLTQFDQQGGFLDRGKFIVGNPLRWPEKIERRARRNHQRGEGNRRHGPQFCRIAARLERRFVGKAAVA